MNKEEAPLRPPCGNFGIKCLKLHDQYVKWDDWTLSLMFFYGVDGIDEAVKKAWSTEQEQSSGCAASYSKALASSVRKAVY